MRGEQPDLIKPKTFVLIMTWSERSYRLHKTSSGNSCGDICFRPQTHHALSMWLSCSPSRLSRLPFLFSRSPQKLLKSSHLTETSIWYSQNLIHKIQFNGNMGKIWRGTSQMSTREDIQCHYSLLRWKRHPQWASSASLPEWLKYTTIAATDMKGSLL